MPDPTPSSDEIDPELLRRARTGDEAAFGAVMRFHYERIFRLVYAMVRNEHDARDLCQEIWLTVWKQLPNFRGDAKFTTWLHPIAVRRAIDHLRKQRRWYDRFLPFATGDETVESVPEPAGTDDTRQGTEQAERRPSSAPPSPPCPRSSAPCLPCGRFKGFLTTKSPAPPASPPAPSCPDFITRAACWRKN